MGKKQFCPLVTPWTKASGKSQNIWKTCQYHSFAFVLSFSRMTQSSTVKQVMLKFNHHRPQFFFLQTAHLAMIDSLMMAYSLDILIVERVMASICQYSSCFSEEDTPYDTEDAVTTWINKVGGRQYYFKFCMCKKNSYSNSNHDTALKSN